MRTSDGLVAGAFLVWLVLVPLLARTRGPRLAVTIGVLGAFALLPKTVLHFGPGEAIPVDKRTVGGLALLLGLLVADPRALARPRPSWLDLPMVLFLTQPLLGLTFGTRPATLDAIDLVLQRALGWGVPYLAGRLFFAEANGPRDVLLAIVWAGLAYVPVCIFEEVVGPDRYVARLMFGIEPERGMVDRLGGWRPEGFLSHGLELASCMALTAVMAVWAAAGGAWRPGRVPGWVFALALVLTSISCRGVYGYLLLAAGLLAIGCTRVSRERWALVFLGSLPLIYMGLRLSGAWDAQVFVKLADRLVGRPTTVAFRLGAEDALIARVLGEAPTRGFGTYVWHAPEGTLPFWPDGWWLHPLWMGGLVGLTVHLLALYLAPAMVALSAPRPGDGRSGLFRATWGLGLFFLLFLLDGVHNTSQFTPAAWAAGAIVGHRRGLGRSEQGGAMK